jgi:TIR domain
MERGEDFIQAIKEAIASCDVLLAVIGRNWLVSEDSGVRWLENPNDPVRLEIATALARQVRVIPVLVQGATMPAAEALPDDLKGLARRQAVELRDTRWEADVDDLRQSPGEGPALAARRSVRLSRAKDPCSVLRGARRKRVGSMGGVRWSGVRLKAPNDDSR